MILFETLHSEFSKTLEQQLQCLEMQNLSLFKRFCKLRLLHAVILAQLYLNITFTKQKKKQKGGEE